VKSILIVDDNAGLLQSFDNLLSEEGYEVRTAASGEDGIKEVEAKAPDLVVMDIRMSGMSGLEALKVMREIEPRLPVIIMTAFATTGTAIEATKIGAFDYVLKPFEVPDILDIIVQAIEAGRFMRDKVGLDVNPESGIPDAIIGKSETMQEVYKSIGRAAPTDATVLIRGESGTGKELVARAVYQHSLRADKTFHIINCVAIPESLLESELFGYEKGAFTGAVNRKIGKIEQANGGTIFLDEIGDMPMSIQSKILRLLQEKSIERLGGKDLIPVDVRIIAATNRDLETALKENSFREDLYYRLKVVTIELPPLKNRISDISPLTEYFLAHFSREMEVENPGISAEAKRVLESHAWPGNVRELANTIHKSLIFSRGYPIREEDISQTIAGHSDNRPETKEEVEKIIRAMVRESLASGEAENILGAMLDQASSIIINEVLTLTGGNRSRAAKILGLSRPTLQSKMEKYNLQVRTYIKNDL
jgi:DNA-binding NtrC family response regulator